MKNFKLFEKCNRRIARRVTLIAVLLAMCIPQAWASEPHFYLTGPTPTGSWSNSATEWKLSSPASSALSDGTKWDEYCTYMWLSEDDQFGLNNGSKRYSRNDYYDIEIKEGSGSGIYGYPANASHPDKCFNYRGATGLVRINAAQSGSGDSYGNQGEWYPYIWVEESLETAILTGSKIMFYFGIADSWKTNWFYLSKEGDQSANKAYKQYFSMSTRLETRIAVAYVDANTTYYIASAQSGGTCIKMSSNAAAGNLYSLNSSGGNNIYVNTGNVPHFATTSVSKEVGTTNSTIAATDANSIYGNAYTFHYYYTTDGGSTFTKFDPTDISDLTTGRYIVYALGWDGHILVKSDNSVTLDITVPITLDANGGSDGAVTSINATYGVAASTGNIAGGSLPTKTDYVFTGFYTSGGTKVIDADGEWVSDVSGYTNAGGNWTCTAASTLYAHWEDRYGFYGTGGDLGSWDVWKGLPNTATNTYSKSYSLTKNTTYIFKIVDRNGSGTWWGNKSGTNTNLVINRAVSGTAQQLYSATSEYENITITPDVTGDYTFSFNTSTNKLTVTYPESYKVIYNKGTGEISGSVPTDDTYYLNGADVTVKDNVGLLQKAGYVFAGWATSDGASSVETGMDPADSDNDTYAISSTTHNLYPVWKPGFYLISLSGSGSDGTKNPGSGPFMAPQNLSSKAYTVNDVCFSKSYYQYGGTSVIKGASNTNTNAFIFYDTKTTKTSVYVYAWNKNSKAESVVYNVIAEGESTDADQSVSIPAGEGKIIAIDASSDMGARVGISVSNNSNLFVTQIKVVESGTTLPLVGEKDYQLAFPGRPYLYGKSGSINGINIVAYDHCAMAGDNSLKLRSGTYYVQFTTTAATQLKVSAGDGSAGYVCTNYASASSTGVSFAKNTTTTINLNSAGTYYITGADGSNTYLTKIAFDDFADCTEPTAFSHTAVTSNSVTLSITDGEDTGNYEFYYSTSSTTPNSVWPATTTSTSKTPTISGLTANTTYYIWVRSKCSESSKSDWVALTGSYFTTTSSCSATANAGSDKETSVGVGVAMAATAASSGYTGAWSIKASSPSTDAGQLGTTSSNTMTFTPNQSGTYTLIWTVTDNSDGSCSATDEATVTVTRNTPTQYSVSGTAAICSGENTDITLANSQTGASYQLKRGGEAVGEPKVGETGSALTWNVSAAGTYTVSAVQTTKYTAGDMTGSAVITFKTNTAIETQPTSIAKANVSAEQTLSVVATGSNLEYQWYSCSDAEKTGATELIGETGDELSVTPEDAGVIYYYCVVSGDCGDDVTSNVVSITAKNTISPTLTYNAYSVAVGSTLTATLNKDGSTGSVTYISSNDAVATVASDGTVTGVSAGTVTITATIAATSDYWSNTVTSSTITVTVPTYSVTYKANNGTAESDVVRGTESTFADNSTTDFTVPATKAFTGWNTKADGSGTHYDVGDDVPGSLTVYADWKYKVLYLTTASTSGDDLYDALKDDYVVTVRTPRRAASFDYSDTTALVVLHESLNGDSAKANVTTREVYQLRSANVPILNTKSYFYTYNTTASNGRWGWGTPDNGKTCKGAKLNTKYANVASHPIFDGLTITSDSITIIGTAADKAMQPVASFQSGYEGYTLATSLLKSSSNRGTAIQEMTPTQRGASSGKYLLISVSSGKLSDLNSDGVKLFQNAAKYLIAGSAWVPQYKITHSAASEGSYTIKVGDASAVSTNTTSAAGTTITLAATPEDGYKLDSWTVTGDVSSGAITVTSNQFTMPAEAVTVAATFVEDSYTISFDGNGADGGTEVDDVTGIDSGNDANLPENTWTKTEHDFVGWKTNVALTYVPNGGGDAVNVAVDGIVPNEATIQNVTSNITLTAQWHAKVYNVYFFAGEDARAIDGYTTYEYGEQKAMPTNVIRTGYVFEAWYDNSEYTGDPLTQMPADATGNKYYYAKWHELSSKCLYITRDVITAYNAVAADPGYYMYNDAKYVFGSGYDASESTLVLEAADGRSYVYLDPNIGEVKQVEVHISDITDSNVEGKGISWGFTNNEANVESVDLTDMDQITSNAFTFRPTDENKQYFVFKSLATTLSIDNICVFYEPQTYTVTYDKGAGATGTVPATATYNYNDVVTVEAGTDLAKDGYTFRGWFDGTTFYVIGDKFKVTHNTTLNAVWQSDSGCEGRSVGSLFKMQVKTGLTNGTLVNDFESDFCTLTTDNYLSTLKGGTAKAQNKNSHTTITGTNAICLSNNDSYIEFSLPSAIQAGDLIIYSGASGVEIANVSEKPKDLQMSIAAGTNVTVMVGAESDLVGYSKIYMYRQSSSSTVTYFEVRRPVFYMSVGTPSATNFAVGTTAITTDNGLEMLIGATATVGCKNLAGDMKFRGSTNYDLHFYDKDDGYLKLDLDNALAQGDVISFTVVSGNNQLAITTSATWDNTISTSSKSYTIPALSDMIGKSTIYLWGSGGQAYVKTLSIIRAADAVSGGGEAICHFTVSFACKTGFEALDGRLPENTVGVPSGAHIGTPEDPFAIGYAFLGWYDDAACSDGHEVDFETLTITENTTIYAKWENNVHTFVGGTASHVDEWEEDGNWEDESVPNSAYPYCYSQIYVKAPAKIAKDTKAHVGRLDIVNNGSSNTGQLTIASGAMLIVYDKVSRITNWSTKERLATIAEDIYIGSERDDEASWREQGGLNGALIMGDYDRETQADSATVQFASLAYTKSSWTTEETAWGERDVNQYIGIPFAHAKVSDYKPYDRYTYTNVYLYEHDRWNNSWSPMYDDDQDMSEFTGYDLVCFSLAPDDYTSPKPIFDLKGELASTDEERRIRLREYEGYYGAEENETMLANSWTAPIDIASFEVSDFENAEATIYMFNAGTSAEYDGNMEWASNYSTYPGQYTAIPINDLKLHPYYYEGYKTIPSMQSFSIIVLDDDGNSGTRHNNSYLTMDYKRLVYDPAVEAASVTTERMHAPRRVPTMEEEPLAIMLHVHGMSGMGDRIRILEREDFSFGRDNGWETSKLLGIIEAPSLYAVTEVGDQATVAVPDVEGLGLTFQAGEYDNVYTFNFEYDENEEPLYLLDKKTGIYTRVLTENTYSFVTTDKNFNERFLLTRNYQIPEVATGLENAAVDSSLNERVQKVLINDMIYILRDGHIYDATGKMLK